MKSIKQYISFALGFAVALVIGVCLSYALPVDAARENDVWVERLGTYVESVFDEGRDVLINGSNKYLNFGTFSGSSGYGFRDNGGDIEWKDNGGSWSAISGISGGGGGDSVSIDGAGVTDPDFVSSGDIDFVDTSNTITANINAGAIVETDLDGDVDPADGDFLQYDEIGTNFTWRSAAETKSDLTLDNVENTALSTWSGTTNITTLGTIATGVWQGTAITDTYVSDTITVGASGSVNDSALSANVSLLGSTINANELASEDFGDFTCNGTTCSLDDDTVGTAEMADADFGAFTFSSGVASLDNNVVTPNDVFTTGQTDEYCLTYEATGTTWEWQTCGAGGGDSVSIDGAGVTDPDFVSSGDIDFVDTSNTITANINAGAIVETDLDGDVDPADGDFLQYDEIGTNFTWRSAAETKSDLTLDNVENTALSTWSGTTNITTLGTIATGVWQGTAITDTYVSDTITVGASGSVNDSALSANVSLLGSTINANELASEDFGDFTCNGTTCSLDATYLTSVDISDNTNLAAGRSLTLSGDSVEADAELYTDTISIWFENPTADDDFKSIFENDLGKDLTITEISCESDQTVNLDLQVDDGTPADVNGSDLACTSSGVDDISFAGDSTISDNETLDLAITSVSGSPTWVHIQVTYTIAD